MNYCCSLLPSLLTNIFRSSCLHYKIATEFLKITKKTHMVESYYVYLEALGVWYIVRLLLVVTRNIRDETHLGAILIFVQKQPVGVFCKKRCS